jgi:dienelactone hydrolase
MIRGEAFAMPLAFSWLLLFSQNAVARPAPSALPTGEIVDRVVCLHDARQSYALYLPSGYRPDRRWPILYAFDPGARGRVPVALFREAAERFGYVVVGSNNSRNGPVEPVFEAVEAVWTDTNARLAVDPKRVYATGMSGGTLPALALGIQKAAGVVACAGALDVERLGPSITGIDWLGIAGRADFNYALNKTLVHTLAGRGLVARFETFDGSHGWPPPALAERALEWLELSTMRSGARPADATFVDAYRERGVARARDAVGSGRLDDAAEEYAALARELRAFGAVDGLEAESRRLHETREARSDRKREARLEERERQETRQLVIWIRLLQKAGRPGAGPLLVTPRPGMASAFDGQPPSSAARDAFPQEDAGTSARRELESRIDRLRRDCGSTDDERRILARRVIDGFRISALYDGMDRLEDGKPAAAEVALEFCVRAQPENAYSRYQLARAHAALGDRKRALAELRRAVEGGYGDGGRLASDPEWSRLRDDPELVALLAKLQAMPR